MTRLVKKYGDPSEPGLVVYLNLHHDLVAVGDNMAAEQLNLNATAPQSDYVPAKVRQQQQCDSHVDLLYYMCVHSL